MSTKDDGGPAFPYKDELGNMFPGMSLRDYFAGQWLAGLAATDLENTPSRFASDCYAMADAMLKARGQ